MLGFTLGSLWNRRFVVALTVLSIALSVALILGVERLRTQARDGFANSASGIDLIVAPRGNQVQILMATVFGTGSTGTGLGWETFEAVEALPQVAWAVPLQMGDNHRGFPVIGTTEGYFDRFGHSGGRSLDFASGRPFSDSATQEAVIGAEIAQRFGYEPGSVIVNAHGAGRVSFDLHDDTPFEVTGILARTGTAVDRMVIVSLASFDAMHADRTPPPADPFAAAPATEPPPTAPRPVLHDHDGDRATDDHPSGDMQSDHAYAPEQINAIYVGLTSHTAVLGVQRALTELRSDPVSAVIPALALTELWSLTGVAERAMQGMAWAVAFAGMIGMIVMLSATLETRRREFAILRSVGATPGSVFRLIVVEAAFLMIAGITLGAFLLAACTALANPILTARFGLSLPLWIESPRDMAIVVGLIFAGLAASLVPALRVYRMTLVDGLSVRL